jgi:hypothetical protein
MSIILTFGLILTGETLTILVLLSYIEGPSAYINIGSMIIAIFGAIPLTYYYQTRYVRRTLRLDPENFTIKVGKKEFNYSWNEFSLVALATSSASYGAKGFMIRLYEDTIDSDYIDLPLYRFPNVNAFEYRELIEKWVYSERKTS